MSNYQPEGYGGPQYDYAGGDPVSVYLFILLELQSRVWRILGRLRYLF